MRRIVQTLFLVLFTVLFFLAADPLPSSFPVDLFLKLDPLDCPYHHARVAADSRSAFSVPRARRCGPALRPLLLRLGVPARHAH